MLSLMAVALALTVLVPPARCQAEAGTPDYTDPNPTVGYITLPLNESLYPHSPPVYPTPNATGSGWELAHYKAKLLLNELTLEEKASLTAGRFSGELGQPCVGNIAPIPRLGFGGVCLSDSDLGIGNEHKYASGFAPGITVSATWNKELMRANAAAIGAEFRKKGIHVALGPVATIARYPGGGTNYEGYGADPYLNGVNVAAYVAGLQSAGVQATLKQFAGYDSQQYSRMAYSSNIPDKAMHEVYSWPYAEGIRAGAAATMCSYNYVNNSQACQNSKLTNAILKTELGFQGYHMTDWFGLRAGVPAAEAGLDLDMPGGYTDPSGGIWSYFGTNLTHAVQNGTLPLSRLDDMVLRILTPYYALGQDQGFPTTNLHDGPADDIVDAQSHAHNALIRQVAAQGTILLKNTPSDAQLGLPLRRPRRIALFGRGASANPYGADSTFLASIDDVQVGAGAVTNGWGSGTTQYPHVIDPLAAVQRRAKEDLVTVDWALDDYDTSRIAQKAGIASVCLAFVMSLAGEGYDRNLTAWHGGDDMVLAVAANCRNTVVVVHAVGPIIMEPWIEHANVTAVVWANLPGQESGDALVDILWGKENPSGKLPYTIARRAGDYVGRQVVGPTPQPQINYTEGVFTDYRYFAAHNVTPRFPFGFGLSYTTFAYSALAITASAAPFVRLSEPISFAADAPGGDRKLFESVLHITANVTNTGEYFGREVAQLYLGFPEDAEQPPAVLRGFGDLELWPGQMGMVEFDVRRKDVSWWSVVEQRWRHSQGTYKVWVGSSAEDLRLMASFVL